MSQDKNQDLKKGLPNGFLFFMFATFLLILIIGNVYDTKQAKVSFSYQLEHLVNLDLIHSDDSKKIALNDNLVTFQGKFVDQLTENSKNNYKFLNLLNQKHQQLEETQEISAELDVLKSKIVQSADWFLHLTGEALSLKAFSVIGDSYDTLGRVNSISIEELSDKDLGNIITLKKDLSQLSLTSSEKELASFENNLSIMIKNMTSPILGISKDKYKQTLRDEKDNIAKAEKASTSEKLKVYTVAVNSIESILLSLAVEDDQVRLADLRSVRDYREALINYSLVLSEIDDNIVKLEKARENVSDVIWFFNSKEISTKKLEKSDVELYYQWFVNADKEWSSFNDNAGKFFKAPDQPLNIVLEKKFKSEEVTPNYMSYLLTIILPVGLVLLLLYFLFSRQVKGMGGGAMNFGKSPAKLLTKDNNKITFKDVAGVDEALEELKEIVEFLKNPSKFTALGGKIPKGVLCVGSPGTGKTLIAKAVAGEADRPFFSISGSDFVEMFVGVGASRIRDMFEQAKKSAPCIIFMDEIDAVGRHRGAGIGGGHDEREQTLNQLLVELDGFDTNEGVILMAATNRPDVLDKALLRPGRFDRRVMINLPDIKGRHEILKVHAKKIKLNEAVNLENLARSTPGCSGADLANILNEAALLAARKSRTAVTTLEMDEARDKVLYGKERRSMELDESEKKTTAYHESGHAVVGLLVEHSDPVDKVTIVPRGFALGVTMFLPKKNRVSYWKKELTDRMAVLLGGRVAEELFVGDASSGAQQDIQQATQLARSMVCEWGMSEKLGMVAYDERSDSGSYLGASNYHEKKYSESSAKAIDAEVKAIIESGYDLATKLLKKNSDKVELMTEMLMQYETLDDLDLKEIIEETFTVEKKNKRVEEAAKLHKQQEVEPPPIKKKVRKEENKVPRLNLGT